MRILAWIFGISKSAANRNSKRFSKQRVAMVIDGAEQATYGSLDPRINSLPSCSV